MIKSIIVEDDPKHSERLRKLIAKANNFIEIKEICDNVTDAIDAICKYKPDLVFLDISLKGNNKGGFEILGKIEKMNFDVIFTTAHIDDNINEIRRCGLHYVVKPYIPAEIEEAITKYENKRKGAEEKQLKSLKSNLFADKIGDKVIYINFDNALYPILVKEIIYCSSKDSLVTFVIKTQNEEINQSGIRRHNVTTNIADHQQYIEWNKHITMKALEADFSDLNFCRIHNQFLVNMLHVKKFIPGTNGSGLVKLSSDENLEVSTAGKKEFLRKAGKL